MAVSRCEGFLGSEVVPPRSDNQHEWAAIYRFDTNEHLQAWMSSPKRDELLKEGRPLCVGDPQVFLSQDERQVVGTASASMIVAHRMLPGKEDAYRAWQEQMIQAQAGFDGYVGTAVFPPIEGIQDNWTVVVRFESSDHREVWMSSSSRRALVRAGESIFDDMTVRRISSGFGAWFGADEGRGLPLWKQTVAVFAALYPLTLIITLWGTDPLGFRLSTDMLIGVAVSVALLLYLIMPLTTRVLAVWMKPSKEMSFMATAGGILAIAAFTAATSLFFSYVTTPSNPHAAPPAATAAK